MEEWIKHMHTEGEKDTHTHTDTLTHMYYSLFPFKEQESYFSFTKKLTELKKHAKSNAEIYKSAWNLETLHS